MKILKARYLELGWNAERLATASGLAKTTAFNSINGKRATTMSELEALAKALGLTPWRVMRQAEDALEAAPSNVLRFPATSRQENQREADAMLAEQRYAASQLRDGEEDADQYPEWD